jgi:2-polyprenyl-3-methyl-5-hydroxy-6-metoxy-1,4-benzoquinol methylase
LPSKKVDVVLCTDVLEHIPEDDLGWLIRDIFNLSNKIVFLNVSTVLAIKTFTSGKYKGENVHVSVFDHAWWVDKIKTIHKDYKELKIYLTSTSKEGILGTCIKGDKDA